MSPISDQDRSAAALVPRACPVLTVACGIVPSPPSGRPCRDDLLGAPASPGRRRPNELKELALLRARSAWTLLAAAQVNNGSPCVSTSSNSIAPNSSSVT